MDKVDKKLLIPPDDILDIYLGLTDEQRMAVSLVSRSDFFVLSTGHIRDEGTESHTVFWGSGENYSLMLAALIMTGISRFGVKSLADIDKLLSFMEKEAKGE